MFQTTVDKIVLLAVLMPVVPSMGGVAGTQSLTIITRAIALGQINKDNAIGILRKELLVGILNGFGWAIVVSMFTYWWFERVAHRRHHRCRDDHQPVHRCAGRFQHSIDTETPQRGSGLGWRRRADNSDRRHRLLGFSRSWRSISVVVGTLTAAIRLSIVGAKRTQVLLDPFRREKTRHLIAAYKCEQLILDLHRVAIAQRNQLARVGMLEQQEAQESVFARAFSADSAQQRPDRERQFLPMASRNFSQVFARHNQHRIDRSHVLSAPLRISSGTASIRSLIRVIRSRSEYSPSMNKVSSI